MRMFSDLQAFQRDQLGFLMQRGLTGSKPLERLYLGPGRVFMVRDPGLVKPLLKSSEAKVDKGRFIHQLRKVVGISSLTLSGEEHAKRRAVLHSYFAKGAADRFVPLMTSAVRETCADVARAGLLDAHGITAPLTLRLICTVMFGADVLTRGDQAALVYAVGLVEDDLAEDLFRVLPRSPWGARRVEKRRDEARQIFDFVIARVRKDVPETSILAKLESLGLSEVDIRDELLTMLLAGHHTTGSAAAWIMYFLATKPELADALMRDAQRCTGEDGEYDPRQLARCAHSLGTVKEVLRLYPSAHWFSRDVKTACQFGGVSLRAKDALLFVPWQLHRDPSYWSDPEQFDPTRKHAGEAYIPFGTGPRACLGMGIALLELQLIALEMASAFTLTLTEPERRYEPRSSITLVPPPIALRVQTRSTAAPQNQAA